MSGAGTPSIRIALLISSATSRLPESTSDNWVSTTFQSCQSLYGRSLKSQQGRHLANAGLIDGLATDRARTRSYAMPD